MNLPVAGFNQLESFESQIGISPAAPAVKPGAQGRRTESNSRAVPHELTAEARLLDHFPPCFETEDHFHSP
jgi:hypothetical protein